MITTIFQVNKDNIILQSMFDRFMLIRLYLQVDYTAFISS